MDRELKGYKVGERDAQGRIRRLVLIDDPDEQRRRIAELSARRQAEAAAAARGWLARIREERRRRRDEVKVADAEATARGRRTARRSAGPRRG